MKIGFFYPRYYPVTASASVHGYQIAQELVNRGHTLLSCTNDENPDCVRYPATKIGTYRLMKDADVLYIRLASYFEHVSMWKLVRPFSLPVIWEINAPLEERYAFGDEENLLPKIKRLNRKRRFYAKFVDASVCVSRVIRDYSEDFLKIKKSVYVSNGSDPHHFSNEVAPASCTVEWRDYFKVVWAGNPAMPWQAMDLMVDVCKKIERKRDDILFVFICSERKKFSFPPLKNIRVIYDVNYIDMPKYLVAADVCMCLYKDYAWSKYGFYQSSLKLFDYMAAGKTVIASDMGQLSEVIKNGLNGFILPNSVDLIAEKIIHLAGQKELLSRIGRNARKDITSFYNWQRAAEQIEMLIFSLLEKR